MSRLNRFIAVDMVIVKLPFNKILFRSAGNPSEKIVPHPVVLPLGLKETGQFAVTEESFRRCRTVALALSEVIVKQLIISWQQLTGLICAE
jgi:hypothetical protein